MISIVEEALMPSASMTEEEFVTRMSELAPHRWRYVATRASWYQRRSCADLKDLPDELLAVVPLIRDVDEWARIRRLVNNRRRQIHRAKEKEKSHRRTEQRRAYMRDYMTRYRSQ